MTGSSLGALGGKVVLASSSDELSRRETSSTATPRRSGCPRDVPAGVHRPAWAETTGIDQVTIDSYNVKSLKIETNTLDTFQDFQSVAETEFEQTEGQLQSNAVSLKGTTASHLRFIITSGYDPFVSVHRVSIQA
ncbi:unnamed protein product [Arctogadus glacialis]